VEEVFMIGTPPVSCVCPTYGRPVHILEECVECFLRQDYVGKKELIILNDHPLQFFEYEHPQIKIINCNKRFRTLGEKENASVALASHDIIFIWEDDDIFLPHRISYSIKMFDSDKGYFKPSHAFVMNDGVLQGPEANLFHSQACWYKKIFDCIGGYGHVNVGADTILEMRFEKYLKEIGYIKDDSIELRNIFYIYRWGGTGTFHGSWWDESSMNKEVDNFIIKNNIPMGKIKLNPHWNIDYNDLINNFINTGGNIHAFK